MICFVDTETLGLDPDRHAIWEVGAVFYDERSRTVVDEQEWQIALSREELNRGDPVGMKIGRFEERRWPVERLSMPDEFAHSFDSFVGTAHLAGAVVSFDEERLRRLLLREQVVPRWHYHLIDVEILVVGYIMGALDADDGRVAAARELPWRSDDLAAALGVTISEDDRHTALGDARWALRIYETVTG